MTDDDPIRAKPIKPGRRPVSHYVALVVIVVVLAVIAVAIT